MEGSNLMPIPKYKCSPNITFYKERIHGKKKTLYLVLRQKDYLTAFWMN